MLETVIHFKTLLEANLPPAVAPFVMLGLGVGIIFIIVQLLEVLFKLIKILVVAGLAIGVVYLMIKA